ncbi:MAG: nucleotidyl transferase AbiEii/AbiGii toxin family protein [Bacteroidota bacterium]
MKLHEDAEKLDQAIEAASQHFGIRSIYIEKDYWVTYALKNIFNDRVGNYAVFKGGTSLSKCYSLIHRFSEDIDIVVITEGLSKTAASNMVRRVSKRVGDCLTEDVEKSSKHGQSRRMVYKYDKKGYGEDYGQISDLIRLDVNTLGYFEPNETISIRSYIADMMDANNQEEYIAEYKLESFPVKVLRPERTLAEKIMSLVRFSYEDEPIAALRKKIRHIYDLHKLLSDSKIKSFFNSDDFDRMILKVGQDDKDGINGGEGWHDKHPAKALIYSNTESVWKKLNKTYSQELSPYIYDDLPSHEEVMDSIMLIKERIKKIEWELA